MTLHDVTLHGVIQQSKLVSRLLLLEDLPGAELEARLSCIKLGKIELWALLTKIGPAKRWENTSNSPGHERLLYFPGLLRRTVDEYKTESYPGHGRNKLCLSKPVSMTRR